MVTLTLISLLNFMAGDFCNARASGYDMVRSVLLSYSNANQKFGTENVKQVVKNNPHLQTAAIAVAVTKCPNRL